MKKNDLFFIFILLVLAGALYFFFLRPGSTGAQAVITYDGKEIKTLPLDKNTIYRIEQNGSINIVEIKDGYADIIDADCPDKLCVKQKKINKTNETLVCLPHKIVVEIQGAEENDLDGISG